MKPRAVTLEQQWLAEIYRELVKLRRAVERMDRRQRDMESKPPIQEAPVSEEE